MESTPQISLTVDDEDDSARAVERVALTNRLVLLKSFCRVSGIGLLYCRARLFPDWLVLTGWMWRGRYHQRISLSEISQVDRHPNSVPFPTLTITLRSGEIYTMRIRGAALWKYAIEERLSSSNHSRMKKIEVQPRYVHQPIYRIAVNGA